MQIIKTSFKLLLVTTVLIFANHALASVQDDMPLPELTPIEVSTQQVKNTKTENTEEALADMPVELDKNELDKKNQASQVQDGVQLTAPLNVLSSDPISHSNSTLSVEDETNLTLLWASLLRKDNVIQFAVRQINISPQLRDKQKSVMAKTVSSLLSGVGLIPLAFGNSAAVVGSSIATGNMAERVLYKDNEQQELSQMPTDAELVALSNVVDNQRKSLLENYFSYRQALDAYTNLQLQKQTIKRMAPQSVESKNWGDQFLVFTQLQEIERQLLQSRQTAQKAYVTLARMTGADTIEELVFEQPIQASLHHAFSKSASKLALASEGRH